MTLLARRQATPVTKVRDKMVAALESARHEIDGRFDEAEREVERIAGRFDRRYRDLRSRALGTRDEARHRLHAHPVGLPLAAGAVGFLAGLALGARNEHDARHS